MLKLQKVTFQNFMSFGKLPTEVDLDTGETTLIIGENRDVGDEGTSRNGVGKTTVIQAVLYGLYGKGIEKKMKADDFINNVNEKKLEVRIDFSVNGHQYYVLRKRKPNAVEFYEILDDGTEKSLTLDSMGNTDKEIVKVIGIPYEIFMGVFFMSPHQTSFMAMTTPEQRSFIETALSLDVLAERAEQLKKIRTDIQTDIKLHQKDIDNAKTTNDKVEERSQSIKQKQRAWSVKNRETIAELEEFLADSNAVDVEAHRASFKKIAELKKQLEALPDLVDERSEIKEIERDVKDFTRDLERYNDALIKDAQFHEKAEDNIKETKQKLGKHKSLETYQAQLKEIEAREDQLTKLENDLSDYNREEDKLTREIDSLNKKHEKLTEEIETLESGVCPYCKQSHTDKERIAEVRQQREDYADKIASSKDEIESVKSKIVLISEELEMMIQGNDFPSRDEVRANIQEVKVLESDKERFEAQLKEESPYQSVIDEFLDIYREEIEASKKEKMDIERFVVDPCEEDIAELRKKISDNEKKRRDINAEITTIQDQLQVDSEYDLQEIMSEVSGAEKELESCKANQNPYDSELDSIESMYVDMDDLYDESDRLETREKHCTYLIKLLTDPKSFVRKNIVDQYIPFLNKKINQYCMQIGLPHVVAVNADLTTDIHYMSKATTYYNLSQGERLRLNLATSLAFRDLLASLGKNCNALFFDELIDSAVDTFGGINILKLVVNASDNFWFISHREEFGEYMSRKMVVTKENGFASLSFV